MQTENTTATVETTKTVKSTGKLSRFIAIGNRGTAFATLSDEQLKQVKLNGFNAIFAKTERTAAQLKLRDKGEHQGALWADSCSWIQSREDGESFWLGTLETAIAKKLVLKAKVTIAQGKTEKTVVGYVRRNFDAAQALSKAHKVIACEGVTGGRVEACAVKRENGKGTRNKLMVASVQSVEIVK
jgi:beta-galactosidase/beta-glucuronidase